MKENSQKVTISGENKGRGLFYGVIAVAVMIIMGVGATFAYFTATTSSAQDAVQTGSTTLQLQYISYENGWTSNNLIPADTDVVEYSFEYQNDMTVDVKKDNYETAKYNALCKDDFGNDICSVYVFQVKNTSNSTQTVSLEVLSQTNTFGNLRAMGYEIFAPISGAEGYDDYNNTEEVDVFEGKKLRNGGGDPTFGMPSFGTDGEDNTPEGTVIVKDANGSPIAPEDLSTVFVNRKGVGKKLLRYRSKVEDGDTYVENHSIGIKLVSTVDETGGDVTLSEEERKVKIADNVDIPGVNSESGNVKTFAIVLYIENLRDTDQTLVDAKKTFSGRVIVGPGDGTSGVSGSIGAASSENLEGLASRQPILPAE